MLQPLPMRRNRLSQSRISLKSRWKLGDIAPYDVIVVGDTPYDAEAAGKLNLRTIGVLCGGFPEENLRQAGCHLPR